MEINNRKDLAKYLAKLRFKVGAEIGVLGGGYSISLCEAMPEMHLSCIDSWGENDKRHGEYHKRKYEEAKIRLAPYNTALMRMTSMEALDYFNDNELDFVYIDAGHKFDDVMQDIICWSRKVRRGGIVSGHDYIESNMSHVKECVDAYVKAHNLELHLTNKEHDRGYVSWWFVKK